MKGLKANIFISNNVFYIKSFLINFANIFTYILIYRVNIVINTRYYSKFLKYRILASIAIIILLKFKALIFF